MRAENCTLCEPISGKLITHLTRAEADSMVADGTAKRRGPHRYYMVAKVMPSGSKESSPMLRERDTSIVARLARPTIEEVERLQGWGFNVRMPTASTPAY